MTLAKPGHDVTPAGEMAKYDISIAGVTEARLFDQGRKDVDDALLLYSGGSTHLHGVALLLRGNTKVSLKE